MSKKVLELLKAELGEKILETHSQFGDDTAVVEPSAWRDVALFLRDDPRCAMSMFTDITAVDYPDRDPRFEVVCHLRSMERGHRIRIKARIGDADAEGLEIPSLVPVWKGANWFERECFDMFGIRFVGHPDLRRIMMYEEFQGHPLRKDYPAQQTQPLVEYREGFEKLAPFGSDEGMPFGRQTHDYFLSSDGGSLVKTSGGPAGANGEAS